MAKLKINERDHLYEIRLAEDGNVFDVESEKANIKSTEYEYTNQIQQLDNHARVLDRYDDFSSLKIDLDVYANQMGLDYGIPVCAANERSANVILDHQKDAAIQFLRERRGFGILADPVGYGKTFEAGVILSELAVRNKVKSMLFIVPNQVYAAWIDVIENKFGMGKGVLYRPSDEDEGLLSPRKLNLVSSRGKMMPTRPVIVKTEDFVRWGDEGSNVHEYLFDAIIVDEAHHLCDENGKYAKAMRLLSLFMKTKKEAGSTYCLLLTATPHSGNLDHMFRLWYFVRCEGGDPNDFISNKGHHSDRYENEKKFYREVVCNNSDTIAQFIKNEEQEKILENDDYWNQMLSFLKASKGSIAVSGNIETQEDFRRQPEAVRSNILGRFLDEECDDWKKQQELMNRKHSIIASVKNAYLSRVLGSIMIRQTGKKQVGKRKDVVNVLFYPTDRESLSQSIKLEDNIVIDPERLDEDTLIHTEFKTYDFGSYVTDFISNGNRNFIDFADKMTEVLDTISSKKENYFSKEGSVQYYQEQIRNLNNNSRIQIKVKPVCPDEQDSYQYKLEYTKRILRKHSHEKVLVFFDYDLGLRNELEVIRRFSEDISADEEFRDRIVSDTHRNGLGQIEAFDNSENGILIVKTFDLTEGANLQTANILINFQVTPDPLAMDQRIGRIFRLGQENNVVIYSLADMNQLEGYALMYFSRIGLMDSNSGDATIIAGCNSENMEAIQCPCCGAIELISQVEYKERKKNTDNPKRMKENNFGDLSCSNPSCRKVHAVKGLISIYDFACDTCDVGRLKRGKDGYVCMSTSLKHRRGVLCNQGASFDRNYYCQKKCAMFNCSHLNDPKTECLVVKQLNEDFDTPDSILMKLCEVDCPNKNFCEKKCHFGIGPDAISACRTCRDAKCNPKPYILAFDNDEWECKCPNCGTGTIKKVVARTFAAYIKGLWEFSQDGGKSFCSSLLEESKKVDDIREVLED